MRIDSIKLLVEMKKRDMTQTELAEKAGVSRATINGIMAGRRCTDQTGKMIADVFQINVNDLKAQEVFK